MYKVFIADFSEDFSLVLAGALRANYAVETCSDGAAALSRIRSARPDVLILDLMLPGTPGLDILRAVRTERLCSAVIVTGLYFSDYVMEALRRYQVDYVTLKPCSIQSLLDRVEDLCTGMDEKTVHAPDPHCAISSMLIALNVPTHIKGFRYSRQAILMLSENPDQQVTKEVYPAIAKQFSTSNTAVEKAIRSAIDTAWESRNDRLWRQYFNPAPNGQIPKPTNTQFLTRLADALAMGKRSLQIM